MKNRPRTDKAWRLLVGLFAEVLNPLLVIWLALFICCGYILTLLMPVRIAHWTALLVITLLLSLTGLLLRFRGMIPLGPSFGSGGGATPLGPPVGSEGGSTPLGPPDESGGGSTPLNPPDESGGGSTPLNPPDESGGGSTPLNPPDESGGGSTPLNPPDESGGGSTPLNPPDESGGGSTPLNPPDESGGGFDSSLGFHWRALLPLLPLLIFLPLFHAELTSPTQQVMGHIDIHAGYVNQLRFGATPPENVFVAGHPANYYWLFHTPLAALVELTGLPSPQLSALLNLFAIVISFCLLADILVALGLAERRTLWLGFAIVLVYCALNILGPPALLSRLLAGDTEARVTHRLMLLPGADRRLHDMMSKMLNFNSMAIATLCFITALHVSLRFLRDRLDRLGLILLSACVAVCLAIRPEAALYIVVALLGGLTLAGFALCFDKRAHARRPQTLVVATIRRLQPRFLVLWLVASAGLTLPLLHYLFNFAQQHEANIWIEPTSYYNALMLLAALPVFLPLFLVQAWFAWRERRWMIWFMQCSGMIGLVLAAVLRLPDYGQYKFVFFLSILFALSGLLALKNLARSAGSRLSKFARLLTICLVALAFAKIVIVKVSNDIDAEQREFGYDGNHILLLDDFTSPERLAAYAWIREQTPFDAVVVAPPYLDIYEYAVFERQIYARDRHNHYTRYIGDWYERIDHMLQLFGYESVEQSYSDLLAAMRAQLPGRDLYAVLADSDVAPAVMADAGAELVYEDAHGGAHVYLLNPKAANA